MAWEAQKVWKLASMSGYSFSNEFNGAIFDRCRQDHTREGSNGSLSFANAAPSHYFFFFFLSKSLIKINLH